MYLIEDSGKMEVHERRGTIVLQIVCFFNFSPCETLCGFLYTFTF